MHYIILILIIFGNLITLSLMSGPLDSLLGQFTPNLMVIIPWLFAWLTTKKLARISALMFGIMIDLTGFHIFGMMTLVVVALTELVIYLRYRFFEAKSSLQAIIVLIILYVFYTPIHVFKYGQIFEPFSFAFGLFATCLTGFILYYLLTTRTSLLSRWLGEKI